jgi:N6-adenosine-specific RNA methylase IME4
MWVTNNFLRHGLSLMEWLGFRYVTNAAWAKDRFGLGQYLRGQHELCLFGVMGKLPALNRSQSTLIGGGLLPRRKHSQKPSESHDLFEAVSPGPRLEMFAREHRPGWDVWGNEVAP